MIKLFKRWLNRKEIKELENVERELIDIRAKLRKISDDLEEAIKS